MNVLHLLRASLGMLVLTAFSASAFSASAQAGPLEGSCSLGPQPAASLLLPYFELDLENTQGATTLMSIGSRSDEPTLARVVLWSDWAIPVYAFDLLIPARGLQTLNLRDVVGRGNIPITGDGVEPVGSCTAPLSNPPLDAPLLAELQDHLTGKPSADDGLCRGSDRGTDSVAVGYVTVDVLTDCSATVRYPSDPGYFANDGTGLAGYNNVLYGDWFLIDPSQDLAQGSELVHLVADPEFFVGKTIPSFYRIFTEDPTADGRIPLTFHWQTRFLRGGGFSGGTEFLLWLEPVFPSEAAYPCDFNPLTANVAPIFEFDVRAEDGSEPSLDQRIFEIGEAFVRRLHIDDSTLPAELSSGLLEISSVAYCGVCSPPFWGLQQSWVTTLFNSSDRFSVGTGAIRLNDFCTEP